MAPNANYSDTARYKGVDSLFVFNIDNNDAYIIVDTINYPTHSIRWEEYEPGTGFLPMTTTNARIDISDTPNTRGFKLILADTIEVICWTMINDFTVEIASKDEDGNISKGALSSKDCIWIGYIEVAYTPTPLNYYDPSTDAIYKLSLRHTSDYIADPDPGSGVGVLQEKDQLNGFLRFGINNSWWEDANYTIQIIDDAGLMRSDDVFVTAIRPLAEMETPTHIQLNDKEHYPDKDTLYYRAYGDTYHTGETYSSPGLYQFESTSYNADSLIWYFGDSTITTTSDSIIWHEYHKYGTYLSKVTAINYFDFRQECEHTSEESEVVLSVPSLVAPNVFTPPNGQNPIWRYVDVSITDFEIAVYNRIGQRVHYFEGNIRDWGGWDGTNKNTSNYVSTGVYFYVLKDFSYSQLFNEKSEDNTPTFEDTVYQGVIHVFNSEQ